MLLIALSSVAGAAGGRAQTVSDLLRAIQPGQPAAQPSPPPAATPTAAAAPTTASAPAPVLDTKPVFMSILTNYSRVTNAVVVTNYVVITNTILSTNYFNAAGQQLIPLQPGAAPVFALAQTKPTNAAPAGPDPAVVRSNQIQAIRDLLLTGLNTTSNTLAAPGAFSANTKYQIRIPDGVTVFDRKKGQALTTAMNRAAEQATPNALAAVGKAVSRLTPADPATILKGGKDSATASLLSAEGQNLANEVLAAVQTAATENRVQEAYNAVMLRGGGLLGAVLGTAPSVDINAHITKGVLEAIFLGLNAEEERIRTDPSTRATKALHDAFK